jgi:hypothetical protein
LLVGREERRRSRDRSSGICSRTATAALWIPPLAYRIVVAAHLSNDHRALALRNASDLSTLSLMARTGGAIRFVEKLMDGRWSLTDEDFEKLLSTNVPSQGQDHLVAFRHLVDR